MTGSSTQDSRSPKRRDGSPGADLGLRRYRPELRRKLIDALREYQNATDRLRHDLCEGLGINGTDARTLDMLELHGEQTAGRLAERVGISTGAMTGVLDRLEKRGYVERVRDPDDRRRIHVAITERAFVDTQRYWGGPAERLDRWMENRNEEDLALLARFLHEMSGAIRHELPSAGT